MSEGAEEWISASAARAIGPAGTDFAHTIIEHAKVGLVKARATLLVWDREGQETKQRDCEIPQDFWRYGVETENWDQGDFGVLWNRSSTSWMAGPGGTDSFAYGVTFLRVGIEAMVPLSASANASRPSAPSEIAASASVAKNPGGRPPYDWEAVMIELAAQLYEGAWKPDTQAIIENAIKVYLSGKGLDIGDSTAKDHARPLYHRLTRKDEN